MSYTAPNRLLMPYRHSIDTQSDAWMPAFTAGTTTAVWPSANLAIYAPLRVPSRSVVHGLWFASASTGTGNVDMALYDRSGVAVIAATNAAKIAENDEQVFSVTATTVGPGLYYIGLSSSSGTDTFYRWSPSAPLALAYGVLTEASAYPLPATATFAASHTLAFIPIMGILLTSVVT